MTGQSGRVAWRADTANVPLPKGAVALSDALANANGLMPDDAILRVAGRFSVAVNRIWMHAWPWLFITGVGLVALLARAARRDRLDSTIAIAVVVLPVTLIAGLVAARRLVVSHGAQLCLVALPPEATALLGIPSLVDVKDGRGSIPRHPLMASEAGLQIEVGGPRGEPVSLRDRGVVVDLTASKSGVLSHCVLGQGDRRVKLRVRGRLRLK